MVPLKRCKAKGTSFLRKESLSQLSNSWNKLSFLQLPLADSIWIGTRQLLAVKFTKKEDWLPEKSCLDMFSQKKFRLRLKNEQDSNDTQKNPWCMLKFSKIFDRNIDENYFYNPSLRSFDKRIVIKYNGTFVQSNLTSVDFLNFRIFFKSIQKFLLKASNPSWVSIYEI